MQKFSNINLKVDYKFSQYYNTCDFINKYNLTVYSAKPCIKQVVLELSLEEIINSFMIKFGTINQNNIQIVGVLFVYIISNLFPFISFNFSKLNKTENYCLKIVFNKEQEIYNFLHDIQHFLELETINIFSNKLVKVENKVVLKVTENCKSNIFFELEMIINKYIKNINANELNLFLTIDFYNIPKFVSSKNVIKNFAFLNK